jgi:hypothetical protein
MIFANSAGHTSEDQAQAMHILRFGTAACDSTSEFRGLATSYACTHHVLIGMAHVMSQDMEWRYMESWLRTLPAKDLPNSTIASHGIATD